MLRNEEEIYNKLDSVVGRCPVGHVLIVLGNFNAENAETGEDANSVSVPTALEPGTVTASFSLSLRALGDSGLGVPGSRDRFRAG